MSELRKYLSQMLDEDEVNKAIEIHERQLEEARELEIEIIRKMHLCLLGDISHKEVILSLKSMFEEQLKEQEQ
tara:strand:+ start:346 stop:564 length:219 start_codon:yes stop_codon:yes gene_type:complete